MPALESLYRRSWNCRQPQKQCRPTCISSRLRLKRCMVPKPHHMSLQRESKVWRQHRSRQKHLFHGWQTWRLCKLIFSRSLLPLRRQRQFCILRHRSHRWRATKLTLLGRFSWAGGQCNSLNPCEWHRRTPQSAHSLPLLCWRTTETPCRVAPMCSKIQARAITQGMPVWKRACFHTRQVMHL